MPERTSYEPGTPSWVDIGTDVDGAKAFYSALFGWTTEEAGPPEETGGYGFFLLNGKMVGGYGPQQSPGPPFWSCYVSVDDADASAKKIEAAGGTTIMAPMDVMEAGRMGVFQDTTGAFFSIWQPGMHKGAGVVSEPGAFCWSELSTRDVDGAIAFYAAVFGWKANVHEGEMTYVEFELNGTTMAGMMPMPAEVPAQVPPYWLVYFMVDDVDAGSAKAESLGATTMVPPMNIPDGGRFSVQTDPQGAMFGLFKAPA
jgi:predicted enzyme related to lactoylglutathione lyase